MKPIYYFITEKGKKIKDDPKYLEEERLILKILEKERKNISEIMDALKEIGYETHWYAVRNKLELLKQDRLVEEFE